MRNRNPKMVEILADGKRFTENKRDFLFKCRACGKVWDVETNLTGAGCRISKSKWQCPRGCKLKDLENK